MQSMQDIIGHLAANVAPGAQLLDWYVTDLDMAQVVCDIWLEWILVVMKSLQNKVVMV